MLALSDSALAVLVIGATAVPAEERGVLLEKFAAHAETAAEPHRDSPVRFDVGPVSDNTHPEKTHVGPSLAAERQRRWRERLRTGRMVVPIEVGTEQVDALYDASLLHGDDVENREAIAKAIQRLVDMLAGVDA